MSWVLRRPGERLAEEEDSFGAACSGALEH